MSGMFRTLQRAADFSAKIDPIGSRVGAKIDPGGNALGIYGSKAPPPIFGDKFAEGMGIYGADSAEADAATMNNARIKAIQEGDMDLDAVNRRTAATLTSGKRTTAMTLFGS
jgi:hypothetical protein